MLFEFNKIQYELKKNNLQTKCCINAIIGRYWIKKCWKEEHHEGRMHAQNVDMFISTLRE